MQVVVRPFGIATLNCKKNCEKRAESCKRIKIALLKWKNSNHDWPISILAESAEIYAYHLKAPFELSHWLCHIWRIISTLHHFIVPKWSQPHIIARHSTSIVSETKLWPVTWNYTKQWNTVYYGHTFYHSYPISLRSILSQFATGLLSFE